ncbi:hypothetical protein ABZP36_028493 [Zizania latifolia]
MLHPTLGRPMPYRPLPGDRVPGRRSPFLLGALPPGASPLPPFTCQPPGPPPSLTPLCLTQNTVVKNNGNVRMLAIVLRGKRVLLTQSKEQEDEIAALHSTDSPRHGPSLSAPETSTDAYLFRSVHVDNIAKLLRSASRRTGS